MHRTRRWRKPKRSGDRHFTVSVCQCLFGLIMHVLNHIIPIHLVSSTSSSDSMYPSIGPRFKTVYFVFVLFEKYNFELVLRRLLRGLLAFTLSYDQ